MCSLAYVALLNFQVRNQFEGRRWALPARVFARPLEVYPEQGLSPEALVQELKLLRYRHSAGSLSPGEYRRKGNRVTVHTRGFPFWDGDEPERRVRIDFRNDVVTRVQDLERNTAVDLMRVEPVPIATIYPQHQEDRMLVRLEDVPHLLIESLVAVEDRHFYDHHGLDFLAMARAALVNFRAGRTVQGGSTLTQQLVKNYFLSNERTLWRKFNEAIMAVLLEWHYSKDEILEAYINEVYLGQDKQRAIHGFALASQFYFERRLGDLDPHQLTLLVALVKGPSYYNPRKYPQRARDRRNLVLDILGKQGYMDAAGVKRSSKQRLGVTPKAPSGTTPFPAFLQLVREQLQEDYRDEDLRSEGLMIFTTLDPLVQVKAEQAMKRRLARLEKASASPAGELQAAVVITEVGTGDVVALVGGRDPQFAGYNRALDARRPVGSLLKPFVYLTALSQPKRYTLSTRVDDSPLSLTLAKDRVWSPHNYDRKNHGRVMLKDAPVQSYNVATARLGLALGIDKVARDLRFFGVQRALPEYPSLVLGAADLSPFEVSTLYQTLASGGYRVPLAAIREVMTHQGQLLQRYPLRLKQTADPAAVYLLIVAMHEVTRHGTGKDLTTLLPKTLNVAGKTGTTNDSRDSWFAGFSAQHLGVVWIGRDNNKPTGLTGASGAMRVWADIMRRIPTTPLTMSRPENVHWQLVDPKSGLLADEHCAGAEWIPFIEGSAPQTKAPCTGKPHTAFRRTLRWFKNLFEQQ